MLTRAEERALEVYPERKVKIEGEGETVIVTSGQDERAIFIKGYGQAEKDTIAEVEKWLKANFHHRNCWNADEFCVSLRTYFGIEK